MRSEQELNVLHDTIVRNYPGGLTVQQFRTLTLESADEDGRLYPPSINSFSGYSILVGMFMDDLIKRHAVPNEKGPWYLTAKGREALSRRTCGLMAND